jgi:hypothetical protein
MHRHLLPIAALAAAGCASSSVRAPAPEPSATTTAAVKWSGNFQPQQQRSANLEPTVKNRAFGTAVLAPAKDDANRTRVQLTVNAQVESGLSLPWGIYPGRCGSGSGLALPLIATQTLPSLDVNRNGSAQLDSEIALTLPKTGTFHLNIFWPSRANELNGVLTCANLKAEEAR